MNCNGCSACALICPKHCIAMSLNDDGFYRPSIDEANCINCKLCEKICSFKLDAKSTLDHSSMYSAYSTNSKIRESTSSGGIGYSLALWAYECGYNVCGAAYNYEMSGVSHIVCCNKNDLLGLKGSKYLQSSNLDAFQTIIRQLEKSTECQFMVFGTPCQIAGLHNVLVRKGMRKRVILVDIFCHGVPSRHLWENYLDWLSKKKGISEEGIKSIIFRDKLYSWHEYYMHIIGEKKYICSRKKDPFLKLFTMGVLNQDACFSCQYRNYTSADIRLGDYWGERYSKSEEGFSMVLTQTEIGKRIIKELKEVELLEVPIAERNGQQHKDYPVPKFYDKTMEMLRKKVPLKTIVSLYEPLSYKCKRKIKKIIKVIIRRG